MKSDLKLHTMENGREDTPITPPTDEAAYSVERIKRMDAELAETFVRELYAFVLHRHTVGEQELSYWKSMLMSTGDPIGVFRSFAYSTENKERREHLESSKTEYPHGHFYSPVVDRSTAESIFKRSVLNRTLGGVELAREEQEEFFKLITPYMRTMPTEPGPPLRRFEFSNTSYGFGDACVYWGTIGALKPSRILEIGSGYTSALALDAIDFFRLDTQCTFVDPFPQLLMKVANPMSDRHQVLRSPIQELSAEIVDQLGYNDILFIDSSHVVKMGSDVHFEVTELLPRLKPGVVIHFHDAFFPFEYPKEWVIQKNKSWNELYFIHVFLMFNNCFKIMYFNDYFCKSHEGLLGKLPERYRKNFLINPGGGLWLRRN